MAFNGNDYDYYWTSTDEREYGVLLTYEKELNVDSINLGVEDISTDVGVGNREKIIVLDSTSCNMTNSKDKTSSIADKGSLDNGPVVVDNRGTLKVATSVTSTGVYLNGPLVKNTIEVLTIEDSKSVPSDALGSWDVSASGDGSVMSWYYDKDSNSKYELYIGSEGGVIANSDSSHLFEDLISVHELHLTNLDTSNVTNMSYMFSCSYTLASLDVRRFTFDKVTEADEGENMLSYTSSILNIRVKDQTGYDFIYPKRGSTTQTVTIG